MSMHQKNDRSIHTDNARINKNLDIHAKLMTKYIGNGMSRGEASYQAAIDMGLYKDTKAGRERAKSEK